MHLILIFLNYDCKIRCNFQLVTNLNWWFTFLSLQMCWFEFYTKTNVSFFFCVFTTMSHVPSSICNLFNNLANVSTIILIRCTLQILQVHEAIFGTWLIQTEKRKNNDMPARVVSGTAIRYGDPSHPKKQPHSRLPYISAKLKRFRHMCRKHKAFRLM